MSVPDIDSRGDGGEALADFIGKWRARWPEWPLAEVFVPAGQRAPALAWATLQQELGDAAWGGSDARPGAAKLAWWQEELVGWSRGARRHPLGVTLQRLPAPWAVLAAALPALAASRERARDFDEAAAMLQPVALAIARIDAALSPAQASTDGDADRTAALVTADAAVITACLLQARGLHGDETQLPLAMLARAGDGNPSAAWTIEQTARWPGLRASTRLRRIHAALARERLRRGDAARPLPAWSTLWQAWRAARN